MEYTKEEIKQAVNAGRTAFETLRATAPASDPIFAAMLSGKTGTIKMIDGWLAGQLSASLAA